MSIENWPNAKIILQRAKEYHGFTRDGELSKHLGIDQTTLSSWKSRNSTNLELIIAKCQGVDLNWLLSGEGDMKLQADEDLEVHDATVYPGELKKYYTPITDGTGGISHYMKAIYKGLTVEEAEEEMRSELGG